MPHEPTSTQPKPEKAFLIGVQLQDTSSQESEALLEELQELVSTLGIEILQTELVRIRKISPKLLLGSGKAEALIEQAKANQCTKIIFDDELTPAQQRNWEKLSELEVIDRQEVILDIFDKRAHTKEARLQVELAQLQYMLPRLTRAWTHLHRQRGGGVTQRGEGEKQIELDQRMIRKRISRLKTELQEVIQHRQVQRKQRMRVPVPTGAIVGYTNAGKSSLLNALTGAHVLAEDKLFATLDPTTKRLELGNGQPVLLTDTVGFVRKLPHHLVKAFRATLEEAVVADFLIHMVDVSDPHAEAHFKTTLEVLKELGAQDKPIITVFNKLDLAPNLIHMQSLRNQHPDALFVSVTQKEGLDAVIHAIEHQLESTVSLMDLIIPHDRYDLINRLHEMGAIQDKKIEDAGIHIRGQIPHRLASIYAPFVK